MLKYLHLTVRLRVYYYYPHKNPNKMIVSNSLPCYYLYYVAFLLWHLLLSKLGNFVYISPTPTQIRCCVHQHRHTLSGALEEKLL